MTVSTEKVQVQASHPYAAVMLEFGGQSYSGRVIADLFVEVLLKARLGFFQTKADFQWNSIYKAFHRFGSREIEPIS